MRVILVRDYEKLGGVGDIVNVKDGYAKNYLIPNNIAQIATAGNIKQMEIIKKSFIKKEAKNIEEASKIVEIIDGMQIKFIVNTSPEGKLYGSITNKDIVEKILEEKKVDIDRKKIELEDHIKELGLYDIVVKLYKDVKAVLKVEVVSKDFAEGVSESAAEGVSESAAEGADKVIEEEGGEEVAEYKPGIEEEKTADEKNT
ncbi:MAG: 50S ribosomal protein L9, partial [Actinobacteria bacterium]|nr:50S ribosomal protein L9 [Actinomycetota bacterium]